MSTSWRRCSPSSRIENSRRAMPGRPRDQLLARYSKLSQVRSLSSLPSAWRKAQMIGGFRDAGVERRVAGKPEDVGDAVILRPFHRLRSTVVESEIAKS